MPAIHAGMSAPVMALYQHGESPCRSMPQTPQPKVTALARSNVGATGSELSVRRRTNSIRRGCCDEPAHVGRSPKIAGHAGVVVSDDRAAPRGWRWNDKKVW